MRILQSMIGRRSRRFIVSAFGGFLGSLIFFVIVRLIDSMPTVAKSLNINYRQRVDCTCSRPALPAILSPLLHQPSQDQEDLCSPYATRRGPHQRIISISLFGTSERTRFKFAQSLNFLHALINDLNQIYSDNFILRIHHDDTINATDVICPIECQNANVDFCSMKEKLYIPPKIWRFIPAGDPLVDIMTSRDLDSPLTRRERTAVNAWLSSNKSFHAMRDHPRHRLRMLGGMWGFRPSLNRSLSQVISEKLHTPMLITCYKGPADQTFLTEHVWPSARHDAIVHDSFHCLTDFGHKPVPFPTQRPSANQTSCFVGCIRPCCGQGKMPFGECPKQCRPTNHPEWIYC